MTRIHYVLGKDEQSRVFTFDLMGELWGLGLSLHHHLPVLITLAAPAREAGWSIS